MAQQFPRTCAPTGYKHVPTCTGESKTRQEFKDDCNIHLKIEQYRRAGMAPDQDASPGIYGDFYHLPEAEDFLQASKIVNLLSDAFAQLPGLLRAQLNNDPKNLVHWLSDPDNRAEAVRYGILDEPEPGPTIDEAPPEQQPATESPGTDSRGETPSE